MSRQILLSLCLSSRETAQRKERSSELAPGTDSSQLLVQAGDKAVLPERAGLLKKAGLWRVLEWNYPCHGGVTSSFFPVAWHLSQHLRCGGKMVLLLIAITTRWSYSGQTLINCMNGSFSSSCHLILAWLPRHPVLFHSWATVLIPSHLSFIILPISCSPFRSLQVLLSIICTFYCDYYGFSSLFSCLFSPIGLELWQSSVPFYIPNTHYNA